MKKRAGMQKVWIDIRYAVRNLKARPGFASTSILSLALGIGACTAVFSIVDAVLLRPLPYGDAARIVELREVSAKRTLMPFTEPNFDDLRARNHSFESIAEYSGGSSSTMMTTIVGGSEPIRAPVYAVSADFFRVLGIQPFMGRSFLPEELKSGTPVAIVSYAFWQKQLGARSSLTGTTLRLGTYNFAVVGVLPPNLEFPKAVHVWVSREMFPPDKERTAHNWSVIARLRPGVTLPGAQADLTAIGKQLKQQYGEGTNASDFAVISLRDYVVGKTRQPLLVMFAAVGFLLLVAGTNVANLVLAQMSARRKEFTVRSALGAGRVRLAQQFVTENLLLALLGGSGGALLSVAGVRLMLGLNQGTLPRADEVSVNGRAFLFAVALSVLLAIMLAVVCVLHLGGRELQGGLKEAERGTSDASGKRLRGVLVISQVALTLILLAGAGLLGKTFVQLLRVNPGFQTDSTVVMSVSLPATDNDDQRKRNTIFYQQLLDRVEHLPGVLALGGINGLPMSNQGADGTFLIDNNPSTRGEAEYRLASKGYFRAMGIPILRGRGFDASDTPEAPPSAVISQALAQKYFPGIDPIGRTIQFGNMDGDRRLLQIVGVAGNVSEYGVDAAPALTVYADAFQRPLPDSIYLVVSAQGDPAALVPALRQIVRSLNPELPMNFRTLADFYSASLDARRFSLVIFAVLASVALLLAMLGLYSMISYTVAQRTHEIGIRRALGAQTRDVLALVVRNGMMLTLAGIVIGLAGSFGLTRLMTSLLFGVTPRDPMTFAAVTFLLALVALIACLIPARRATKVDPLVALRYE
jgi:predicted permease